MSSVADNGRRAIECLNQKPFDLVVSDARMPDIDGLEVLRHARKINPSVIAIMITAFGSPDLIKGVEQLGVTDYVEKPFNTEVLQVPHPQGARARRLQQENVLLKRAMHSANQFGNIIGSSSAMVQVFEMVETVAPTGSTVLVTGESGTGKELVARAIHVRSARSERPFVAVNCGALSETLLDSELFGHVRGSFTGADANRKGLIEVADKGTIFLDEIGEMSPMLQVKVLRVLQERKFRRVGGTDEVEADIRIIAATNRDLGKMVADGQFREDLYYRINVIPVRLPALRERVEDMPLLAEHFVAKFAAQMKKNVTGHFGRRPGPPARRTPGPATCASSRTPWSAPSRSSGRRQSCPRACRKRSAGADAGPVCVAGAAARRASNALPETRASISSSTSSISSASTSRRRCGGQRA